MKRNFVKIKSVDQNPLLKLGYFYFMFIKQDYFETNSNPRVFRFDSNPKRINSYISFYKDR